jgi:hypothetical protein
VARADRDEKTKDEDRREQKVLHRSLLKSGHRQPNAARSR